MYRPCDHYISSRISIPFGMLSVCTGQVTHALLTRPPLTPKGSLDLHVLGTPPAFILSQDQTLMLKFFLPEYLAYFPFKYGIYCLVFVLIQNTFQT